MTTPAASLQNTQILQRQVVESPPAAETANFLFVLGTMGSFFIRALFLAAKRSSTRALVLCLSVRLSVRPWSKLNFLLFGQLLTFYDNV